MKSNETTFSVNGLVVLLVLILYSLVVYSGRYSIYLSIFIFAIIPIAILSYSLIKGRWVIIFWVPLVISAVQNLVLAVNVNTIDQVTITTFLVLPYMSYCIFSIILVLFQAYHGTINKIALLLMMVVLWAALSYLIFGASIPSAAASFRNVTGLFTFSLIGFVAGRRIGGDSLAAICKFSSIPILVLLVFGVFESYIYSDFWVDNGLTDLWSKKGLNIRDNGLPGNFYASEKWNGKYIRRMTSLYADPVNFGTNLFLLFLLSWYARNRLISFFCVVMIILCMSKGALLGLFCFVLFYSRYLFGRLAYGYSIPIVAALGIGFLYWALANDAGSVFLHMSGFFSSLKSLYTNPFGYGLGNVGVLASLFGKQANIDITESGLGLIIGQLGLPGLAISLYLFYLFYTGMAKEYYHNREQVLSRSLLLGIFLNIMFNEVALSPNSCAGYFLILGFMLGRKYKFLSFYRSDIISSKVNKVGLERQ